MRRIVIASLSFILSACATEDIPMAHIDDSDAGPSDVGDGPPPGAPCASNGDCAPNEFCERATCGSLQGGCQLRPIICEDHRLTVCGCDGVTYWNDCLRKQRGANVRSNGECVVGAKCRSPSADECPGPRASCARIVPGDQSCPPDLEGACWVLPDVCPAPHPNEPTLLECGANLCRLPCNAIRTGLPHRAVPCPP